MKLLLQRLIQIQMFLFITPILGMHIFLPISPGNLEIILLFFLSLALAMIVFLGRKYYVLRHESENQLDSILNEIQEIYKQVKMTEGTKREMIRTPDGKIRFKGGPTLRIEKNEFYELKESITRIRTEIINNK